MFSFAANLNYTSQTFIQNPSNSEDEVLKLYKNKVEKNVWTWTWRYINDTTRLNFGIILSFNFWKKEISGLQKQK